MSSLIDGLGAPFPGWVSFVLQMTVVFTVAGALLGHWMVGEARRFARAGLLLGALDGVAVVVATAVRGHPLPGASRAVLVLGIAAGLGALIGALGLLPSRLGGPDSGGHVVRGGALGLAGAVGAAVVNAHWGGLVSLASSVPPAVAALAGGIWDAVEPIVRPLSTLGVGVIAGHVAALALVVAAGSRDPRAGSRWSTARVRSWMRWGGAFAGLIAVQAEALAPDPLIATAGAATAGAVLGLVWHLRRRRRAPASSAPGPGGRIAERRILFGALAAVVAVLVWLVTQPLVLAALVAAALAAGGARTDSARRLGRRLLEALPAKPANGARDELPAELAGAARLTGLVYGTNQLVMAFPGLLAALLARDLHQPLWVVILAMGVGSVPTAAMALYRWARGAGLPPRVRVGAAVLGLGAAIVGFAGWPSLVTFVVMGLAVGAVTPTARLVRRTVTGQFPGHEGSFSGRAQTWSFLTSGIGGIVFAATGLGATDLGRTALAAVGLGAPDWRIATIGLGAWVIGVGLLQMIWRRLPAHGSLPEAGKALESAPPAAVEASASGRLLGAWGRLAGGIRRDWRTLASPTVREAVLASVGIYGAFQVIWSRLHHEVTELVRHLPAVTDQNAGEWASLIVAVMGLSRLASIPLVRKHGDYSNESAKQSASQAALILVAAPLCGLAAVWVAIEVVQAWWLALLGLGLLGLLALLADCGGNPTSTAMTAAIARERPSAEMIEALARTTGALAGAVVASMAGRLWPFAVLAFTLLTLWAVSRWREKPSRWGATCEDPGGLLTLVFEPVDSGPEILKVSVITAGAPVLDQDGKPAYWHIWRGDRLVLTGLTDPGNPRSNRFEVARLPFVWTVGGRREPARLEEVRPLRPGLPFLRVALSREPVVVGDQRRGKLAWLVPVGGELRWTTRDGSNALTISSEALNGRLEFDHYRHGAPV